MTEKNGEATGRAKGGHARADKLTPEERSQIASQAARSRWRDLVMPTPNMPRVIEGYSSVLDLAGGKLQKQQLAKAHQAEALTLALADTGVAALIDEATGYQDDRAKDALAKIFSTFLAKERQKWALTFPLDFYKEIYRLRGWKFEPWNTKRPSVIAGWTDDFVYDRLAPGLTEELRIKNPVIDTGRRAHKHHQWFNTDKGHPKLKEHIAGVIALLRAADNWEAFKRGIERAYPKFGETIPLPLSGGGRRISGPSA